MNENIYLKHILNQYKSKNPNLYSLAVSKLKFQLQNWANNCFINIFESGSIAKGTAISLSSDLDLLVSLTNDCNENTGGLASIYFSLYSELSKIFIAKQQNVSIRINLDGLNVDITPARKHLGNTNDHSLYVSKQLTWKQTNIQKHINDISKSGRTEEIKLMKIWRELNKLDFPSIYLEYLLVGKILTGRPHGDNFLTSNFYYIFQQLAKQDKTNPLFNSIIDPANSNNNFSMLLTEQEKWNIILNAMSTKNQLEKKLLGHVIY